MLLGVEQEDNFWHFYSDYLPPPDDCPSLLLASEVTAAAVHGVGVGGLSKRMSVTHPLLYSHSSKYKNLCSSVCECVRTRTRVQRNCIRTAESMRRL